MKKLLLSVTVISAIFLASCSKERTCTCTFSSTAQGWTASPSDVSVTVYSDAKKNEARLFCQSTVDKIPAQDQGGTTIPAYENTNKCELK